MPKVNVDHTISGQGTVVSTLDHLATECQRGECQTSEYQEVKSGERSIWIKNTYCKPNIVLLTIVKQSQQHTEHINMMMPYNAIPRFYTIAKP